MSSFYLFCAILSGGLVAIQLGMGAFDVEGGHHEVGTDTDIDHDKPGLGGLNILSLRAIAAGILMFGIAGGLLTSLSVPTGITFGIATLVGIAADVVLAYTLSQLYKLEQDNSVDFSKVVGASGTAYVSMEPNQGGMAIITAHGRSYPMAAVNKSDKKLETNDLVKVTEVHNEVVYVVAV